MQRIVTAVHRTIAAMLEAAWPSLCLGCHDNACSGADVLCRPCRRCLLRNVGARCGVCDAPCAPGAIALARPLCHGCRMMQLSARDTAYGGPARVRACFLLLGPLHHALLAAKYGGHARAMPYFAELMISCPEARALLSRADALAFVPSHRQRRLSRGYDHLALLTGALAARSGHRIADVLRKPRATAAQSGLPRTARLHNVQNAFASRGRCDGQAIALIDDVVTTGATLRACTIALRQAGAARVEALCLAYRPS